MRLRLDTALHMLTRGLEDVGQFDLEETGCLFVLFCFLTN